jgi:protein O-mannosyl-transferase
MSRKAIKKLDGTAAAVLSAPVENRKSRPAPAGNAITVRHRESFICFSLIILNLIVFVQALGHQFIYLDDDKYVFANPDIQVGLTKNSIVWALTTFHMGHWHPLTWLSYLAEVELFGLDPSGYHFVNLAIHIVNTLLLFLLLRYMTSAIWRSAIVAALFAVHPLHVEPVIWISSRKDLLSTMFGFSALLAYAYYSKNISWRRYLLVFFSLLLGLMSKSMLMTFPFVMLLLDFWPLGRLKDISLRDAAWRARAFLLIKEKIPLFILVALCLIMAFKAQGQGSVAISQNQKAQVQMSNLPVNVRRLSVSLNSYGTYVVKTFWPSKLAPYYPINVTPSPLAVIGSGLLLLLVSILAIRKAQQYPYLPVGWFLFVGTLLPVIRLLLADRYTYIPLVGLFLIVVWGIGDLISNRLPVPVVRATAGLLIVTLAAVSWFQAGHWKNSEILFKHTLAVTKDNLGMHNSLGRILLDEGRFDEAEFHLSEAVRLNPNYSVAQHNLGVLLVKEERFEEAVPHLNEVLKRYPEHAKTHIYLGHILFKQDKLDEAAKHFSDAIRFDPNQPESYFNLGAVLMKQGRYEEAADRFKDLIRIAPGYANAHNYLGQIYFLQGKLKEARAIFMEAIQLKPDYTEARENLNRTQLAIQARREEARLQSAAGSQKIDPRLNPLLDKLKKPGDQKENQTD